MGPQFQKQRALVSLFGCLLSVSSTTAPQNWPAPIASSADLVSALNDWENDYAVFLFSPWCNYCRQFKPIWNEVRKWFSESHVEVVMFNCEENEDSRRFCTLIGVQHYPSVLFIGHGSYHSQGFSLFSSHEPIPESSVIYNGELYYESIRDWCRSMHFLSKTSQFNTNIQNLLSWNFQPKSSTKKENDDLSKNNAIKKEIEARNLLENTIEESRIAFATIAEAYGTDSDIFEILSKANYGFNVSQSLDVDSTNTVKALMSCLNEVVSQYCEKRYHYSEPYCLLFSTCVKQNFSPRKCRPLFCPLHEDGCKFASICLNMDVLDQFVSTKNTEISEDDIIKSNLPKGENKTLENYQEGAEKMRADARKAAYSSFGPNKAEIEAMAASQAE